MTPTYVKENEQNIILRAKEILGHDPKPSLKSWQTARAKAVKALRKEGRLKEYR